LPRHAWWRSGSVLFVASRRIVGGRWLDMTFGNRGESGLTQRHPRTPRRRPRECLRTPERESGGAVVVAVRWRCLEASALLRSRSGRKGAVGLRTGCDGSFVVRSVGGGETKIAQTNCSRVCLRRTLGRLGQFRERRGVREHGVQHRRGRAPRAVVAERPVGRCVSGAAGGRAPARHGGVMRGHVRKRDAPQHRLRRC